MPRKVGGVIYRMTRSKKQITSLSGSRVGMQYESEVVYHNMRKELEEKGFSSLTWLQLSAVVRGPDGI
ncbi:MAG: hypothetical protein QXT39_06365 [Conexivisphaerales archaeon]